MHRSPRRGQVDSVAESPGSAVECRTDRPGVVSTSGSGCGERGPGRSEDVNQRSSRRHQWRLIADIRLESGLGHLHGADDVVGLGTMRSAGHLEGLGAGELREGHGCGSANSGDGQCVRGDLEERSARETPGLRSRGRTASTRSWTRSPRRGGSAPPRRAHPARSSSTSQEPPCDGRHERRGRREAGTVAVAVAVEGGSLRRLCSPDWSI